MSQSFTVRIVLLLSDGVSSLLHQNGQIKGLNEFDSLQKIKMTLKLHCLKD